MPTKRKNKPAEKAKQEQPAYFRTVADNRRARFNFEILEQFETGIVLSGTEIKSVRAGKAMIRDAYAQIRNSQIWLQNLHIAPWDGGGVWNHEAVHPRRLLMHRKEIDRLARVAGQQGLTLVPLRLYIKGHYAKVELALAKGRRRYDKRKVIQQRETDREISRAMRQRI